MAGSVASSVAGAGVASSALASSVGLASSSVLAASVVSAGFSSVLSADFSAALPLPYTFVSKTVYTARIATERTLMVARNLEKALGLFLSVASGEVASASGVVAPSAFLPKAKGKDDFRLSDLTPLTAGVVGAAAGASVVVVSVGTLAGLETSALRGSVASGLGMTGAVYFSIRLAWVPLERHVQAQLTSATSVSLAGTAGAASSAFFLPKGRAPKMLQHS